MKFRLIDTVLETSADRIVAVKQVSLAEEYLADHFPGFPVLPGVLMLEAMVQAARTMLKDRAGGNCPLVLGEVKTLKFGQFIQPGDSLRVEVLLVKALEDGSFLCRGTGTVRSGRESGDPGATAVTGRFTMRPVRHDHATTLHTVNVSAINVQESAGE